MSKTQMGDSDSKQDPPNKRDQRKQSHDSSYLFIFGVMKAEAKSCQ